MKPLYMVIGILLPMFTLFSQPLSAIRPLSIGDTVPNIVFNHIVNYKSSSSKLSDFKGKLVILDFWGKYCSPCIKALPKLDSLQRIFKGAVQVITISDFTGKGELQTALKRFITIKDFQLPVLLANDSLSLYFAHTLVSHVVWIDGSGVVKAITGTEYVTKDNIQTVLDGKAVNWPVKRDITDFDYKKPLLVLSQPGIAQPQFLYYSSFIAHIDGIAPPNGTFTDSLNKCTTTNFYNYDLLALCQIAVDYRVGASRDQFILNVKDTSLYLPGNREYYSEWLKKNTYCYSLRLPSGLSSAEVQNVVKRDLLHWLNLLGIRVEKEKYSNGEKETEKYIITEG